MTDAEKTQVRTVLEKSLQMNKDLQVKIASMQAEQVSAADAEMLAEALVRHRFVDPSAKSAAVQHLSTTKGIVDTLLNVTKLAADAINTSNGAHVPGTTVSKQANDPTPAQSADDYAREEFSKLAAIAQTYPTA